MFRITDQDIDVLGLHDRFDDRQAGAIVAFEGRVRKRNEGRDVIALEYEAYGLLAQKEGERILAEAMAAFPILDAAVVHRVGRLQLGAVAVWIGVAAEHRREAFDACRYLIDQIKLRVPVWKKEWYVDGDSAWVDCSAHEHAASEHA